MIDEKLFQILRLIQKKPNITQRKLARDLGLSLGKLNYCINELKNKGLLKFEKFRNKSNKIENIGYILTPSGIAQRIKLTINFMKKKMQEYDELKKELNQKKNN
tara:strand:+ start:283 stop:594 length:312 start_codon:yes stop_codon:yes gene_type:complete